MHTETITKHTPGPWTVKGGDRVVGQIDGERSLLADCFRQDRKLAEANARLIAAAPELLEALKEIIAALTSQTAFGLYERDISKLRRAEAAIAKAEGR